MRIAFLSDIHANMPALRSALDAASAHRADRIILVGDLVGDGPFPVETLQLIKDRNLDDVIRGNVDRNVLKLLQKRRKKLEKQRWNGERKERNRAWTAMALSEPHREWLAKLPTQISFRVGSTQVLVTHGSPLGDTDYVYPSVTPEAMERKLTAYDGPRPDVHVSGHSHIPFVREMSGVLVVNCGSVGKPRDGDPRGAFAMVDFTTPGSPVGEIIRFEYPIEEVLEALGERDVPGVRKKQYRLGVKV
jgi:putative phosphoesterase